MTQNEAFMKRAIEIALSTKTSVLPNPYVGAVIVSGQKIISEGFHRGPGLPHAEVEAIKNAEKKGIRNFKSCEIFVSLEPCCHLKKRTPPCVPLLIQKKFKRIHIAHLDPNPAVSGRGLQALRKAKIPVQVGLLAFESEKINQAFIKNQKEKMPYVTLKLAMTFDGKMADDFGKSKWITSEEARNFTHQLRAKADAMAVGSKTVDRDNPSLNARLGKLELSKKIVLFGKPKTPISKLKMASVNGAENIKVVSGPSLSKILSRLFQREKICHLFVEGGPLLASEFLRQNMVDELVLFMGKGILGGKNKFGLGTRWGLKRLDKSIRFEPSFVQQLGPDVVVQGFFNVYRSHSKSR